MYFKHQIGIKGEECAIEYLKQQGYKIIERNFECRQGEIDIIAKEKNEYVFIEVKTRSNKKYGLPREAVDLNKQKHIWNVAEFYVYIHHLEDKYIRFDVIEVYKKQDKFYINHIKQIK